MKDLPIRIAIMAAALLVAAVGVVVAAVFVCVALYSFLLTLLSAPLAALVAALLVFVLSLLVIVLGRMLTNAVKRRAKRTRASGGRAHAISAEIGRLLGEDAQEFITRKPILALALALIGGFTVGANPKLRAILQAILKN
jgi:glucan phosphoethanolaminetransferase (alkaline phosphatase superfamily)